MLVYNKTNASYRTIKKSSSRVCGLARWILVVITRLGTNGLTPFWSSRYDEKITVLDEAVNY